MGQTSVVPLMQRGVGTDFIGNTDLSRADQRPQEVCHLYHTTLRMGQARGSVFIANVAVVWSGVV